MLNAVFTLDYEIHGNGDGAPYELMVEPTERMMNLFEQYGAKLTILADVGEILKFKELRDQTGIDECDYEAIARQLCDAVRRGHDVQLHIHASYFRAAREGGRWQQDWSEYDFASLPHARIDEIVRNGKDYLEKLLKPVKPSYECIAFRAANWSMSPSVNAVRALIANGFRIDTSVFKYGKRAGRVNFDYSAAPSDLVPWQVDEADICIEDPSGALKEIPIYCEERSVFAFVTYNRIRRAFMSRRHPLRDGGASGSRQSHRYGQSPIRKFVEMLAKRHAWKADFNQCSGRQLVSALKRADQRHGHRPHPLPFVLIGHSKLFSPQNERSLKPFLKYVADHGERFGFANLSEFANSCESRQGAEGSLLAMQATGA